MHPPAIPESTGATHRLYVELTPGQVEGFPTTAAKVAFWEPPSVYIMKGSWNKPKSLILADDFSAFPDGWQCHDIVRRVCDKALRHELRSSVLGWVSALLREPRPSFLQCLLEDL